MLSLVGRKTIFLIIAIGVLIGSGCEDDSEYEKLTLIKTDFIDCKDTVNNANYISGDAFKGCCFSRTDANNPYGAGTFLNVADSLIGSEMKVCFSLWVRSPDMLQKKYIAVAVHAKDSLSYWTTLDITSRVPDSNKWGNISDTIVIPRNALNQAGCVIKVYVFNPSGSVVVDSDEASFTFKKSEFVFR